MSMSILSNEALSQRNSLLNFCRSLRDISENLGERLRIEYPISKIIEVGTHDAKGAWAATAVKTWSSEVTFFATFLLTRSSLNKDTVMLSPDGNIKVYPHANISPEGQEFLGLFTTSILGCEPSTQCNVVANLAGMYSALNSYVDLPFNILSDFDLDDSPKENELPIFPNLLEFIFDFEEDSKRGLGPNGESLAQMIVALYCMVYDFCNRYINPISDVHNVLPYLRNMVGAIRSSSIPTDDSFEQLCEMIVDPIPAMTSMTSTEISKEEARHGHLQHDTSELLAELNDLIGLKNIKEEMNSLVNLVRMQQSRQERGMDCIDMSLHLVFSGNPGTGKTTVARFLAKIYKSLGVLSKGHLVEVDRSGLVAGYVGQTAIKVSNVIEQAKGGILFIDEAYSLTSGKDSSDYGFEAIDTLLKAMEDNRDDLVVIVAGYPDRMDDFLRSNPGLKSRFNRFFRFPDYTADELVSIFEKLCTQNGYAISVDTAAKVKNMYNDLLAQKNYEFANGRDVRNLFEDVVVSQANRLAPIHELSDAMMKELNAEDIDNALRRRSGNIVE